MNSCVLRLPSFLQGGKGTYLTDSKRGLHTSYPTKREDAMLWHPLLLFYSEALLVHHLLVDNPLRGLKSHNVDTWTRQCHLDTIT